MEWMIRWWGRAFSGLSLGMFALVLLVAWAVAARNLDLGDASWVEDACRLILLWVGLLFVAAIQSEGRHIASDFLRPRSKRIQQFLRALKQFVFLAIGGSWFWYGGIMVQREMGMFGAGGMELPLFYFNAVIPVCGMLIACVAIIRLVVLFGNGSYDLLRP